MSIGVFRQPPQTPQPRQFFTPGLPLGAPLPNASAIAAAYRRDWWPGVQPRSALVPTAVSRVPSALTPMQQPAQAWPLAALSEEAILAFTPGLPLGVSQANPAETSAAYRRTNWSPPTSSPSVVPQNQFTFVPMLRTQMLFVAPWPYAALSSEIGPELTLGFAALQVIRSDTPIPGQTAYRYEAQQFAIEPEIAPLISIAAPFVSAAPLQAIWPTAGRLEAQQFAIESEIATLLPLPITFVPSNRPAAANWQTRSDWAALGSTAKFATRAPFAFVPPTSAPRAIRNREWHPLWIQPQIAAFFSAPPPTTVAARIIVTPDADRSLEANAARDGALDADRILEADAARIVIVYAARKSP